MRALASLDLPDMMGSTVHIGVRILGILLDFLLGVSRAAKTMETAANQLKQASEENRKKVEAWCDAAIEHQEAVRNGTDGDFIARHRKAASEVREMIQELSANRGLALFFAESRGEDRILENDRRPLKDIPLQFSPRELEELAEGLETAARNGVGAVKLHRNHHWLKTRLDRARRLLKLKEDLDADPELAEIYYDLVSRKDAGGGGQNPRSSQK